LKTLPNGTRFPWVTKPSKKSSKLFNAESGVAAGRIVGKSVQRSISIIEVSGQVPTLRARSHQNPRANNLEALEVYYARSHGPR
jgi:hypothetical protein